MTTIPLQWNALDLALILLAACSPGLVAGLLLGARAWPSRRATGAALGGAAGAALGVLVLTVFFRVRIPLGF